MIKRTEEVGATKTRIFIELSGEGDSVGEGPVLVASGPVVYTDEDRALTGGEGTRLVV
jgi:hypothetical protein